MYCNYTHFNDYIGFEVEIDLKTVSKPYSSMELYGVKKLEGKVINVTPNHLIILPSSLNEKYNNNYRVIAYWDILNYKIKK